ncbi:glycosyltransferase [bacterium]|nr:glycosyltransferase [bacterium]
MKVKSRKRIIKFFCNLIPITSLRRKIRKRLERVEMVFPYKLKPHFNNVENPVISIIMPVYNQYKVTYECLKSIAYYMPEVSFEIIIADDGSTDETVNMEKNVPGVKVVKTSGGLGFLKNVQNAVPYAKGKYIFLMNNDMMVTENWLDSSYNLISEDETIGIVGSLNLGPDGDVQEYGASISDTGNAYMNCMHKKKFNIDDLKPVECDYCSGCSILFLKSDWDNLNGFDEKFSPAYYEDTDFNFRVRYVLNKKVICDPKSRIYHYRNMTYSENASILSEKNRAYFLQKWGKQLEELNEGRTFNF